MIKSKAKCEPSLLRAVETVELEDLSESLKLLTDDTYNVSENQVETRDACSWVHETLCADDSPYKHLAEGAKVSMVRFVKQQAKCIDELNKENDSLREEISLMNNLSDVTVRDGKVTMSRDVLVRIVQTTRNAEQLDEWDISQLMKRLVR